MGWTAAQQHPFCLSSFPLFLSLPVNIEMAGRESEPENNLLARVSTEACPFLMEFHKCCIVEDPVCGN